MASEHGFRILFNNIIKSLSAPWLSARLTGILVSLANRTRRAPQTTPAMALMLNRLHPASKFLLLPVLLCLGLALLFVLHGVNSRRQQADLDFVRQQGA